MNWLRFRCFQLAVRFAEQGMHGHRLVIVAMKQKPGKHRHFWRVRKLLNVGGEHETRNRPQ